MRYIKVRNATAVEAEEEVDRGAVSFKVKVSNLATEYPEVLPYWHCEKNKPLLPEHCSAQSNRRVWWKCTQGHEWLATINNRIRGKGEACAVCLGRIPTPERNLRSAFPLLALEWHNEKNGDLTPMDCTPHSSKKVWWRCGANHVWDASISNRSKGGGCPYCSGRLPTPEKNLAAVFPQLASEWHHAKNLSSPETYAPLARKKVWWICIQGHEWKARISSRGLGARCPVCSGKKASADRNLAVCFPKLVPEWNTARNALGPESYPPHSGKKVWWICTQGHEWESTVSNRTQEDGTGCPACPTATGFNQEKKAFIYIQAVNIKSYSLLKFGITNRRPEQRMKQQALSSGAEHRLLHVFELKGRDAFTLERAIKNRFKEFRRTYSLKWDGFTETLPIELLNPLLTFIEDNISKNSEGETCAA